MNTPVAPTPAGPVCRAGACPVGRWALPVAAVLFAGSAAALYLGPRQAIDDLAEAVRARDAARLAQVADVAMLARSAETLMDAGLRAKRRVDAPENDLAAWRQWTDDSQSLNEMAGRAASPEGLQALLRGHPEDALLKTDANDSADWIAAAQPVWDGPMSVHVDYANAADGWATRLTLTRTGLMDWRVTAIDLPAEAILAHWDRKFAADRAAKEKEAAEQQRQKAARKAQSQASGGI